MLINLQLQSIIIFWQFLENHSLDIANCWLQKWLTSSILDNAEIILDNYKSYQKDWKHAWVWWSFNCYQV